MEKGTDLFKKKERKKTCKMILKYKITERLTLRG